MTKENHLEVIEAGPGDLEIIGQPPHQAIEIRSAFDMKPQQFAAGLRRRGTNRKALMEWIIDALVEGTDWGRIHVVKKEQCDKGAYCENKYHFSKPSLWKAGAEKISGMMGMRATWPNLNDEMEAIRSTAGNNNLGMIILKCQLVDPGGNSVSEGIGARQLAQDYGDVNKAFKMAKKSSLIDAVLNAGGLSAIFTQDVEDMPPESFRDGPVSDPYQSGEDRSDNTFPDSNNKPISTHCPIGKEWKGMPWGQVDDGFLNWICSSIDDKPELVAAARKELDGRSVESQAATATRQQEKINPAGKTLADFARDLTACKSIDELTAIRDELPQDFEPALRKFIGTREFELMTK